MIYKGDFVYVFGGFNKENGYIYSAEKICISRKENML